MYCVFGLIRDWGEYLRISQVQTLLLNTRGQVEVDNRKDQVDHRIITRKLRGVGGRRLKGSPRLAATKKRRITARKHRQIVTLAFHTFGPSTEFRGGGREKRLQAPITKGSPTKR